MEKQLIDINVIYDDYKGWYIITLIFDDNSIETIKSKIKITASY